MPMPGGRASSSVATAARCSELEDERLGAIADSVGRTGFAIDSVSLEILGHCERCSDKGAKVS